MCQHPSETGHSRPLPLPCAFDTLAPLSGSCAVVFLELREPPELLENVLYRQNSQHGGGWFPCPIAS
jgi:hypothetical protein